MAAPPTLDEGTRLRIKNKATLEKKALAKDHACSKMRYSWSTHSEKRIVGSGDMRALPVVDDIKRLAKSLYQEVSNRRERL